MDKQKLIEAAKENIISVGGYCRNNCIFCIYKNNLKDPHAKLYNNYFAPYISMNDFELALNNINHDNKSIFIFDKAFLGCDALDHPLIYDFLQEITDRFPEFPVTIISSGTSPNIDIDKLNKINNLMIHMSVNFIDKYRSDFINETPEQTQKMMNMLTHCTKIDEAYLFFTPDSSDCEYQIRKINSIVNRKITYTFRVMEYIKYCTNKKIIDFNTGSCNSYVESLHCLDRLANEFNVSVYNRYIPASPIHRFHQFDIQNIQNILSRIPEGSTIIVPDSTIDYIKPNYHQFNIINVHNEEFGGSVTCYGLLSHKDIKAKVKNTKDRLYVSKNILVDSSHDYLGDTAKDYDLNIEYV